MQESLTELLEESPEKTPTRIFEGILKRKALKELVDETLEEYLHGFLKIVWMNFLKKKKKT